MTMQTKKLIAREGMILLGVVVLGLAVYLVGRQLNSDYLGHHYDAKFKVIKNMKYSLIGYTPYLKTMSAGINIALFGYPVIAAVRFILWANKVLKKK